ncbi:MAG: sugar nucleotide-binding protein, partial [Pseudomonadota bacterium]
PGPLSHYGTTKLESEEAVRKATDRHCIIRTAWLYGATGNNFLKAMLKKALDNPSRPIKVVNDRYGSPTWAFRLALQIKRLIEGAYQGTFHATAEGYCTWYELASYFLDAMEVPHSVQPCSSSEYVTPAARPVNSILKNQNLKKAGINLMQDWCQDIDEFVLRCRDPLLNELKKGEQRPTQEQKK